MALGNIGNAQKYSVVKNPPISLTKAILIKDITIDDHIRIIRI